jgi:hypothetical protein
VMTCNECIADEIKRLEFDTRSAQRFAREGRIEEWIHKYLMAGPGTNPEFSLGLKMQKRWWKGPVEVPIGSLARCVGPEPGMEYLVTPEYWHERTLKMAEAMTDPLALPPLIVEYRGAVLSVRDGNTRLGAMEFLGWPKCWVIFWYNTEDDYRQHSSTLK